MTGFLETLISEIAPKVGLKAVEQLAKHLEEISDDKDGMKKMALNLLANSIEKFGPLGISKATEALEDLIAGKEPDLDWASPRVVSDVLAQMQNAAAEDKSKTLDFMHDFSRSLGVILSGVLAGIL